MHSGYIIAGVVVGTLAAGVATWAAGGGHGTYIPGALLFPFTMLLAIAGGEISPLLLGFALVQFPAYGYLLALREKVAAMPVGLALVHTVAATAAIFLTLRSDAFG